MNENWPTQSANPFVTRSSSTEKRGITPERTLENPLKIESDVNFNVELATSLAAESVTYKPLPLPEDMLGFDPIPAPNFNNDAPFNLPLANTMMMSNSIGNGSFNIDNFLRTDCQEEMGVNDIDDDFLNANLNLNMEGKDSDLEKVLLDLGISEAPVQDLDTPTQRSHPQKRGHKRQLSGSEIFGFIGVGDNTQLSIGNMEPIQIVGKKPRYREDIQFDILQMFSNILDDPKTRMYDSLESSRSNSGSNGNAQNVPRTPNKFTVPNPTTPGAVNAAQNRKSKLDYYVPSGSPQSFKFPPSPPKGSFVAGKVSRQLRSQSRSRPIPYPELESGIQSQHKPQTQQQPLPQQQQQPQQQPQSSDEREVRLSGTLRKEELITSSASASPEKMGMPTPVPTSPLNSVVTSSPLKQRFQTPKSGSPRKFLFYNGVNGSKCKAPGNDTTILVDDNDKTISEMATPIHDRNNIFNNNMQTPTKKKGPLQMQNLHDAVLGGSPRRRYANDDLKGPNRLGGRKKPTITSTLQSGTLDQYFIGPTADKKFICKFYDKEIEGVCDREFGRISNVRAHVQTHLSDRPFVCDECGKAFVRNHDLKRHMKGHSGAANVCPCGKKFPRSDALKRHRLRNICVGGLIREDGIERPGYGLCYSVTDVGQGAMNQGIEQNVAYDNNNGSGGRNDYPSSAASSHYSNTPSPEEAMLQYSYHQQQQQQQHQQQQQQQIRQSQHRHENDNYDTNHDENHHPNYSHANANTPAQSYNHQTAQDRYTQSQTETPVSSQLPMSMSMPMPMPMPMPPLHAPPQQRPTKEIEIFDFNTIPGAEDNYSFHIDDSMVM
jgi:metallothionein expression activator